MGKEWGDYITVSWGTITLDWIRGGGGGGNMYTLKYDGIPSGARVCHGKCKNTMERVVCKLY